MSRDRCPNCGVFLPKDTLRGENGAGRTGALHADLFEQPRPDTPYVDSPHRSAGSFTPEGIVLHFMAGTYNGSISWFQNPQSRVSAHFLVARDGRRTQMVPLPDPDGEGPRDGRYKAWHCKGGNGRYIGIEHEGNGTESDWTEEMLSASAEIAAYVCNVYGIPIQGPPAAPGERLWFTGIGGHDNVPDNDHTDPGSNFPWEYYLELVAWYADSSARTSARPSRAFA